MAVHIDTTGTELTVPGASGAPLPAAPATALVRLTTPGGAQATVLPGVGFNLIDWRVPGPDGPVPLIHAEPDVLDGGSGTRSGSPILFPFPNRIAGARYTWAGREFSLPAAHPGDRHAIHGFCAKTAWRDVEATGDAAVTGRFRLSRDAPESLRSWPGDLELAVTFALTDRAVRITSKVRNPGDEPVPFGLGFHPYFTPLAAARADDLRLWCPARSYWELDDMIPTGALLPVAGERDLRAGPQIGARNLDDVLTGLPEFADEGDELATLATLAGGGVTLALRADESFRDVVVFTPANRESLAVEPYTCPTDAVHLAAAGRDVGWRTLAAGGAWTGVVEYALR